VMDLMAVALLASGLATRYEPGIMAEVIANRERWQHIPPGVREGEALALLTCEHLGGEVWLELRDGSVHGPYIVADCAQSRHREMLEERGWAVDLSYPLAMRLGVIDGPMPGVRVWAISPLWARRDAPRPH
jgi:hypothetical protein